MTDADMTADLRRYLQEAREALVWKLEGLGEYDIRRPLVPTGTNLLGLVKHMAGVEAGYLGETFGRTFPEELSWMGDDAEDNADMWATPAESRDAIDDLYRRVWAHSDTTITQVPLAATGRVAWWPADRNVVTLHRILLHLIAETHRHAGHADIVRELIDGAAGLRAGNENLPSGDADWWAGYRNRVEQAARPA
ncbi:putative damage-inducible protein DinB [Cryobacterium sp. MP_3.1]|uniref:DinB family protein n=1 Tax=Cryobacterium sp. MP_3.1 TaxID=3071711 RepID=UPI002E0951DE|nr:putative damage-inducible protein DinB [Cryobacterium sp. MP_3.1]